jgi:hypothetical protein
MDTSDLKEISTGEDDAGRNKSHIPLQRLAGSKEHQLIESDKRTNSGPINQTNKPGAKSVNGTRFTIERVHESEMEGSPVHLSMTEQSKCSPLSKQSGEFTMTEPYEKTDIQYASSLVSNVIPSRNDVLNSVITSPHPVTEFKQGTADVLSDRIVRDVDEVGVGQEEGELKGNRAQVVNNDKSSAKEGQELEVETDVKPKEKTEEDFQREYQEQLEAGQEEYQTSKQRYQDCLAKEIQKLEEDNEKALQRHREILAQRLKESIIQLETEQVHIYSFM